MKIIKSLFYLIFSVSGIILYCLFILQDYQFYSQAERATGRITSVNSTTRQYKIVFTDARGTEIHVTKRIGGGSRSLHAFDLLTFSYNPRDNIGVDVDLLYDKTNPKSTKLLIPSYYLSYVIGIFGLLMCVIVTLVHGKYLLKV